MEIGTIVNCSESTVSGILKRRDQGRLDIPQGGSHKSKCTLKIHEFVEEILHEDCTKTLAYLKQSIVEKLGVNLSLNTIFRALGFIILH